ncbi:fructose-6-phosphate aldolase, TalC/MipB family [Saccharicrinis carchari]|uniref:Fructose-6-phosphate aldolase, TalC/MipB family n=1 Tax=Saccharicrinis carchari TaxID=1168039 RepID=A0A521DF83_SACCC|nr:transaldolase family protein [Saccharicrinis carchari]SMO70278.1 fructose-6-phosphate aldolase, TalC/MipB family [Saccharicrinis carchari]
MELYLDSADINEIEEAFKLGFIDGLTTTPTFMHRHGITDIDGAILKLSKMVPVLMIEALGDTAEEIVAEAKRLLSLGLDKNKTVFKIPASLVAAKACKMLRDEGMMVNIHLVYNIQQAYMAMAAGATYVCVLVGRMQDQGYEALKLVDDCVKLVNKYNYDTKIMFSSVRYPEHIKNAIDLGAQNITIPWKIMKNLNNNNFTEIGTHEFVNHTRQMTMVVGEVVGSKNPIIGLDGLVTDASIEMTRYATGAVSVVDADGKLKGIFTDGDLRRQMNTHGKKLLGMKMSDFDLKMPIHVNIDDKLHVAVGVFKEKQVDNIIAVSDGKPAGMLDVQDLVKLEIL